MLKRITTLALAALMALSLVACGNSNNNNADPETTFSADLNAFYSTLFQGEEAPVLMEMGDEMLEQYFPGFTALERVQTVAYGAAISFTATEVVMVELANAEDVAAVQAMFQARIDAQVGTDDAPGGAWYPEAIEAWRNNSEIVTIGNYVCMFVADDKDEIVSSFRALG